jgi:hypothetical protein
MGALTGCGDKKIRTGTFIDSPVENIAYSTDAINGRTDSGGNYSYRKGENIAFSINDLSFGSTSAEKRISPIDLVTDGTIDTAAVINRAILLQSLDLDGDTSNGITIPELAFTISGAAINFDQTTEAFSNDGNTLAYVRAAKSDATAALVTAATAKAHLAESLNNTSSSADPEVGVTASSVVVDANEEVILTGTVNSLISNFRWEVEENSGITLTLGSDSADLTQFQASFNAPSVSELTNYTIRFVGIDASNVEYSAPVIIQVNPVSSI